MSKHNADDVIECSLVNCRDQTRVRKYDRMRRSTQVHSLPTVEARHGE
ncbi:hypothetical protein XaavBphi31_03 [Xanthomonas phage Xaa_vB_phi31]|uniref:Uncharacterized protein n=1 Tax=Xanthomonas phage Xaa_vB_phi31 TaxID=2776752 RepID=A0A868C0A9_9CAUD|nr:hypothetical protein XaavBphi31_03 [Xanthomonas phage Xaa_vB_phi31]